jgi:hypothetical protein
VEIIDEEDPILIAVDVENKLIVDWLEAIVGVFKLIVVAAPAPMLMVVAAPAKFTVVALVLNTDRVPVTSVKILAPFSLMEPVGLDTLPPLLPITTFVVDPDPPDVAKLSAFVPVVETPPPSVMVSQNPKTQSNYLILLIIFLIINS